jgi:hypothetical protein
MGKLFQTLYWGGKEMKKSVSLVAVFAFLMVVGMGSTASADTVVTGMNVPVDQSVMGVGQTMMQMGARDRAMTSAVNNMSRTIMNAPGASVNTDFQFGSSQSDQSWKQWRTVEDVGVVVGLVPGDCRGDNSGDAYRKAMGQNRDGYMKEPLVSQADCDKIHATVK